MPTIDELPLIDVSDLIDTDLVYVVKGNSPGSGDKSMTVEEFNKSHLPAVFCVVHWGASDQDTDTYNTWFKVTGWGETPNVDTYSLWNYASQRIEVPSDLEGAYWINGVIRHDRRSDDNCDRIVLSIRKNGSEKVRESKDTEDYNSTTGGQYDSFQIAWLDKDAVAGDYYELYMYLQVASTFFDQMRIRADVSTYHQFAAVRIAGRDEV